MGDAGPEPPRNLPDDLVERLSNYPTDQLRSVARYAEQLAEHREQGRRREAGVGENRRPESQRPENRRLETEDESETEDEEEGGIEDARNAGIGVTRNEPGDAFGDRSDDVAAGVSDDVPDDDSDDAPFEIPDDVPGKATLTVKEINDNRYYYWQWREGDQVTSKYDRPVDPDD